MFKSHVDELAPYGLPCSLVMQCLELADHLGPRLTEKTLPLRGSSEIVRFCVSGWTPLACHTDTERFAAVDKRCMCVCCCYGSSPMGGGHLWENSAIFP